jgi:hypothetical protein
MNHEKIKFGIPTCLYPPDLPGAPLIKSGVSGHEPQQGRREQKGEIAATLRISQRGSLWWVGLLTPLPGVEVLPRLRRNTFSRLKRCV